MKPADKYNELLIERYLVAAARHSGEEALEIHQKKYTYEELTREALKIAYVITRLKDERHLAGLLAYRSAIAYSGVPGILAASKGYVPLNPQFPLERTAHMIKESGIKTVVVGDECAGYLNELISFLDESYNIIIYEDTESKISRKLISDNKIIKITNDQEAVKPEIHSTGNSIAYLLFTSGSTGKPKAVPVSNANVCSYLDNIIRMFEFDSSCRFSQTFDLTFDLSVHDMFVCWLSGGCLVIPEGDSSFAWSKYIKNKNITVWFSVPSLAVMLFKMRLLKPGSFKTLKYSFFCGEPLYCSTAKAWQEAAVNSRVVNLYGPTETTIAIASYHWNSGENNLEKKGTCSIGKIFYDHQYLIVGEKKNTVEKGEKGELCLSGDQVVESYFNDKENTAKYFFMKNNKKWYRTGDLVTGDEYGNLYYLGRLDNEVKISGYRVNLFEIDHLVREYSKTENVVSVYHKEEEMRSGKIITFIHPDDLNMKESDIINYLRGKLPYYMIPERVIYVDRFFYNPNGKVDREKLIRNYL